MTYDLIPIIYMTHHLKYTQILYVLQYQEYQFN